MRVYSLLLSDYACNSELINHVVVKMLYRIAFQLNMAPLLYQISVFRTFLAILSEPCGPRLKVIFMLFNDSNDNNGYPSPPPPPPPPPPPLLPQELQKLSAHVVRGFFSMAACNPLMFVELLFWKTSRDCYELEMGYGTVEMER